MNSKWKKKDSQIDLINFVAKKGEASRAQIIDELGQSFEQIDSVLEQLEKNDSIMKTSGSSKDSDTFQIPKNIQKKSFNDLISGKNE